MTVMNSLIRLISPIPITTLNFTVFNSYFSCMIACNNLIPFYKLILIVNIMQHPFESFRGWDILARNNRYINHAFWVWMANSSQSKRIYQCCDRFCIDQMSHTLKIIIIKNACISRYISTNGHLLIIPLSIQKSARSIK